MNIEQVLGILTLVVGLLAVGMTVVGAYLGYLSYTLERRLRDEIEERLGYLEARVASSLAARLAVIDGAIEVMCQSVDDRDAGLRDEMYLFRHLAKLGSVESEEEIEKALLALEGFGAEADHLLPYVERLRTMGGWSKKCEDLANGLFEQARERVLKSKAEIKQ